MAMLNNQRVFVYTVNPSLLAEAQFDPGTADIPMFVGLNPEIYPIFSSNAALESPILMVTALIKLRQVKSKVSRFCRVNPIKSHFLTILFQSYESVKHCFFSRINHIIFSFWTTKTWFFAKKSTFFLIKMCWKNRKVAAFLDSFAQLGYAQPLLRAALEHARVAQGCPGGSNVRHGISGWSMFIMNSLWNDDMLNGLVNSFNSFHSSIDSLT